MDQRDQAPGRPGRRAARRPADQRASRISLQEHTRTGSPPRGKPPALRTVWTSTPCAAPTSPTSSRTAGELPFVDVKSAMSNSSTTSIYTSVSSDFRVKTLRSAWTPPSRPRWPSCLHTGPASRAGRLPYSSSRRGEEGGTVTRRNVSYQWRLREVMAAHGMFATTDLVPPLNDRGIELSASQVHRLVTGHPERLSLPVLAPVRHLRGHPGRPDPHRGRERGPAPRRRSGRPGCRRGGEAARPGPDPPRAVTRLGRPPSCRREPRAQLSELLDAGRTRSPPRSRGSSRTWCPCLSRRCAGTGCATTPTPETTCGACARRDPAHPEGSARLPSWRTAGDPCACSWPSARCPADRQILLFERWYRSQLKAVDDPQHAQGLASLPSGACFPGCVHVPPGSS